MNLDVSNAFAFALIVRFVPGQAVEFIFNLILRTRNVPIKTSGSNVAQQFAKLQLSIFQADLVF